MVLKLVGMCGLGGGGLVKVVKIHWLFCSKINL